MGRARDVQTTPSHCYLSWFALDLKHGLLSLYGVIDLWNPTACLFNSKVNPNVFRGTYCHVKRAQNCSSDVVLYERNFSGIRSRHDIPTHFPRWTSVSQGEDTLTICGSWNHGSHTVAQSSSILIQQLNLWFFLAFHQNRASTNCRVHDRCMAWEPQLVQLWCKDILFEQARSSFLLWSGYKHQCTLIPSKAEVPMQT